MLGLARKPGDQTRRTSPAHDSRGVIVVTGSSAGLGRAIAKAFAQEGATVALLARGEQGLDGARLEVAALGGKPLVFPTDVSDFEQVERAASRIEEEFGPIRVWINNAMVSVFSPAKEMSPLDYKRVTEVTYLGYVHGTLAALKRMLPRNCGTIIQVGSALAYRAIPLQSAYCAAKHAIRGFTDSVRCELLHDGSNVRISMVQMPALNTTQFKWVKSRLPDEAQPVPPIFQPEVGAEAVVWAAHHYRPEWEVGLSTSFVIKANKIAHSLADHYLGRTGFRSQQIPGCPRRDDANNLDRPLDEQVDFGTHGDFDERAHAWSGQFWLSKHRAWLFTGGAALLGAALYSRSKSKDR